MLMEPGVLRQCFGIPGTQLAQGQIHEPPPLRRPRPYEEQILRAEEHGVQYVGQRRAGFGRYAVHRHLSPFAAEKLYLRGERSVPRKDLSGKGSILPFKADQLPVAVGAGAFSAGEVHGGLQQVGLSLCIFAVNDVAPLVKSQRLPLVVPPAVQRQLIEPHR